MYYVLKNFNLGTNKLKPNFSEVKTIELIKKLKINDKELNLYRVIDNTGKL